MRTFGVTLAFCGLAAIAIPGGAGAQVGGLLKKKAAEVTGVAGQNQASQADASGVYDGDVLELTEPVMRGFMNGLRVELAGLEAFARLMDTYRRPDDYARCGGEVSSSPEGMEIMLRMANLPDNASADEMQRAMAKIGEDMAALVKVKCGPDAGVDWPQSKRRERVAEIQAEAAAAAGPVGLPFPSPESDDAASPVGDSGPSAHDATGSDGFPAPDFFRAAASMEAARDSMTLRQYGISHERAENYCLLLESGAIHPLQPVVHPAPGGKVFWIYSEVEARAIEPHCKEILEDRLRRNALFVQVYWEDPQSNR